MDKTFAIIMLLFFTFCAGFITYAAINGHKRNHLCKFLTYLYVTVVWLCVFSMAVIIKIY